MLNRLYGCLLGALLVVPQHTLAQNALTLLREPEIIVGLRPGISQTLITDRVFRTIQIASPEIVDAIAETDRRITFIPKAAGETMVRILDDNNNLVGQAHVIVTEKVKEIFRETYEGVPGRVKIHNHSSLTGATIYSCGTKCELVEEIQSKIAPPTPTNVLVLPGRQ